MGQLLLIRHGETPLNVARVLQPAATPLSGRGQWQAQALGRRLADAASRAALGIGPVQAVISSDLPRAWQTAQAVAQACGLPLPAEHAEPLLQERNFGDLRGLAYDSLGFDPLTAAQAPPGGESLAGFQARCDAAWVAVLAAWQQRAPGGVLAVVTHGLVLRHWLNGGRIVMPSAVEPVSHLHNTSLSVVAAEAPHAARWVNCASHLDEAHAARGLSGA